MALGRPDCIVQVRDNRTYADAISGEPADNRFLAIEAADGSRPHLRLDQPLAITGDHDTASVTLSGLLVEGLMTVGRTGSPADARAGFAVLRDLADRLDLTVRSMGMSGDLEVAVEEGSTMVRVGSALFGPRPSVPGTSAGPR